MMEGIDVEDLFSDEEVESMTESEEYDVGGH